MKIYTEQCYDGTWRANDENYDAEVIDGCWVGNGVVGEGLTKKEAIYDYWSQQDEQ
jgi:hypothetical protein